jgi:hypothetical protein
MVWPLVIVGYLVPALIASLALRPAGDLIRRWGSDTGCACR